MRINAQLVSGKDGTHLWADRYDRDLTDIFAIQDEITHTIVDQLKVRLLPEEKKAIEQTPTGKRRGLHPLPERAGTVSLAHQVIAAACARNVHQSGGARPAIMRAPMPESRIAIRSSMPGMASRVPLTRCWTRPPGHWRSIRASPRRMRRGGSCSPAPAETRRRSLRSPGRSRSIRTPMKATISMPGICLRGEIFEGAIEHYGRAAEIQPDDYRSPLLSVTAARSLGRHDQAAKLGRMGIERAEHALKLHPESADPAQLGATTLASLGQHERAREWIGRALAADSRRRECSLQLRLRLRAAWRHREGDRDFGASPSPPAWEMRTGCGSRTIPTSIRSAAIRATKNSWR